MYVPSEMPQEIKDLALNAEILVPGTWDDKCFMYGKLSQKRFLTTVDGDSTKVKRIK